MKLGRCSRSPARNRALPFIVSASISCIDCGTEASDSAEQRASRDGRRLLSKKELPSSPLRPNQYQSQVATDAENEEGGGDKSEMKYWISSYLQHGSWSFTRKVFCLVLPKAERQDFSFFLRVTQQNQLRTNQSLTQWGGGGRSGFNKTLSIAPHLPVVSQAEA